MIRVGRDGVVAALTWAAGETAEPPMAHPGTETACRHPASAGVPDPGELTRERRAAEEHVQVPGYRHGDHSPGYADAAAAALRWLTGETTSPPVRPG